MIRVCPLPSGFITYSSKFPSRLLSKRILRPSDDQDGEPSKAPTLVVSRVCPEPSAFITYTSTFDWSVAVRSRSDWKRIFVPSGDHAGAPSFAESFVRRVSPEPSALITQICAVPDRLDWKTIFDPSGDQLGMFASESSVVSRVWPLPSAFMT